MATAAKVRTNPPGSLWRRTRRAIVLGVAPVALAQAGGRAHDGLVSRARAGRRCAAVVQCRHCRVRADMRAPASVRRNCAAVRFEPDTRSPAPIVIELEPRVDRRGTFARAFCAQEFAAQGLETNFVQANISTNTRAGTVRGMHFQRQPHAEVKLVRCIKGVDLRRHRRYARRIGDLSALVRRRTVGRKRADDVCAERICARLSRR